VTSTTGAAPEIAGGGAILVDPFAVEGIQAGLEQATQAEEAARLRALGYARAALFRWSQAAEATIESYRRAMS
jgi:glycosyltransferase involved in cell wall biosynthesis